MRKKVIYNIFDISILSLALILFIYRYWNLCDISLFEELVSLALLFITVVLVNIFKMFRLYLALYGSDISFFDYIKTYCKVTPVSIVLPFKLGEIYRMLNYGIVMNNMLKAVVVVLLDRFMDTIALIGVVLSLCVVMGGKPSGVVMLLVVFLVILTIVYFVFPGLYCFWKKFLIGGKASTRKIWVLECMDKFNSVYKEVEHVVKGRGIVMFAISLVAWMVEIGNVAILSKIHDETNLVSRVNDYLAGTLVGGNVVELKSYGFVSFIFLAIIYALIVLYCINKRGNNK